MVIAIIESFIKHFRYNFILRSDILHSVFGLPSECTHNNIIRSCTLSFTCWIQGGRHAQGCGDNKWLFSCCVPEGDFPMDFDAANTYNGLTKANYFENNDIGMLPPRFGAHKFKSKNLPKYKQNMLHRRMDDDATVSD